MYNNNNKEFHRGIQYVQTFVVLNQFSGCVNNSKSHQNKNHTIYIWQILNKVAKPLKYFFLEDVDSMPKNFCNKIK